MAVDRVSKTISFVTNVSCDKINLKPNQYVSRIILPICSHLYYYLLKLFFKFTFKNLNTYYILVSTNIHKSSWHILWSLLIYLMNNCLHSSNSLLYLNIVCDMSHIPNLQTWRVGFCLSTKNSVVSSPPIHGVWYEEERSFTGVAWAWPRLD